jgi:uncharacterized HAD superfamily protein
MLGGILLVIGLLGFCITMYLADLRFESLLYARAVNKIRFSIYNEEVKGLSTNEQIPFINYSSILLGQPRKPNYYDTNQFLWIVLGLGIIDSFYLTYSVRVFLPMILGANLTKYWFIFVVILFSLVHLLGYFLKSKNHEDGSIYFKNVIGSDIDGVISNQNAQFVIHYNLANKDQITLEDIVTVPVHKAGKISLEDEKKVFQETDYWKTLEVLPGVKETITKLRINGYRIALFTSRPWKLSDVDLEVLTQEWLNSHQIEYNSLNFDNGRTTRFDKAQSMKIKYFIEDDLGKAVKLCTICKAVFLIDYKYNQTDSDLPYNLIRIKNFSEIANYITLLD